MPRLTEKENLQPGDVFQYSFYRDTMLTLLYLHPVAARRSAALGDEHCAYFCLILITAHGNLNQYFYAGDYEKFDLDSGPIYLME